MNRAEGPVTVEETVEGGYFVVRVADWVVESTPNKGEAEIMGENVEKDLVKWLKTKQGAEWMRENGIGGGK